MAECTRATARRAHTHTHAHSCMHTLTPCQRQRIENWKASMHWKPHFLSAAWTLPSLSSLLTHRDMERGALENALVDSEGQLLSLARSSVPFPHGSPHTHTHTHSRSLRDGASTWGREGEKERWRKTGGRREAAMKGLCFTFLRWLSQASPS